MNRKKRSTKKNQIKDNGYAEDVLLYLLIGISMVCGFVYYFFWAEKTEEVIAYAKDCTDRLVAEITMPIELVKKAVMPYEPDLDDDEIQIEPELMSQNSQTTDSNDVITDTKEESPLIEDDCDNVDEEHSESPSEEGDDEIVVEEERIPGVVPYTTYTPVKVNSKYYVDVGRTPHTMEMEYATVDDSYFADACFIGDSRTMGIYDYSEWEDADFFCDNGYCLYRYSLGKTVTHQNTGKKVELSEAMGEKQYGKVYIMLGVNDGGYGTTSMFKEEYQDMLAMIMEKQPEAQIYLLGNMHISASAENGDSFTNGNINAKNVAIAECADGITSIYLDFNELFTDEDGYLISQYTFDGFHLYAAGYMTIIDFIKEHAVL